MGRSRPSAESLQQIQQRADSLPVLILDARRPGYGRGPRQLLVLPASGLFDEGREANQDLRPRLAGRRHDGPVAIERCEIQRPRMQPAQPLCDALP